jgi:hypothetical protein
VEPYDTENFRAKVGQALEKVRTILDVSRSTELPSEVDHKYDDKYLLAEFLTSASMTATLNALELLGLNERGKMFRSELLALRSL